MKLSNKAYDILKWVVMVALPATEALWLTLGNIWHFPYVIEIGSTIAAITVFLGALLGVSGVQYKKVDEGIQTNFNTDGLLEMMEVENEDEKNTAI